MALPKYWFVGYTDTGIYREYKCYTTHLDWLYRRLKFGRINQLLIVPYEPENPNHQKIA